MVIAGALIFAGLAFCGLIVMLVDIARMERIISRQYQYLNQRGYFNESPFFEIPPSVVEAWRPTPPDRQLVFRFPDIDPDSVDDIPPVTEFPLIEGNGMTLEMRDFITKLNRDFYKRIGGHQE